MTDLVQSIKDLKSGTTTSQKLVEACLDEIASRNDDLNALLQVYDTEAIAAAQASDKRRHNGEAKSDFDGIPVVLKANISNQGHITSAASRMLEHYIAPYDASVVTKLKEAGAIIIASANMDEFAMGGSGENSAFGPTKNPLNQNLVPGGSSSGSAASVAAGFAPLALGSDTGGSIRLPAAFCGVVGLKPTYGAVSRYGLLAMASSLDQIGPMATTVEGVQKGYELIQGFDPLDSTSQNPPSDVNNKSSLTIGVPKQFFEQGVNPKIIETLEIAIKKLENAGHTVNRDIDLPILKQAVSIYYIICPAEVSANMARYDGIRFGLKGDSVTSARSKGLGNEVKRRIMLGTYVLSAGYADKFYKRGLAARAKMQQDLTKALEGVDMILGPVSPNQPFKLGEKNNDPLALYLEDLFAIPANLTGRPAISVPAGWTKQDDKPLPIGLQLMGNHWEENNLFTAAKVIEEHHEK